ncbi:MAG: transposase [Propionibacteriaceae bacterium]|jgi:hypothetical protein|nr:transposase [Propionibacteriaceae bacterium]
MAVIIETFGVHYKWEIPKELKDQLWLAHRLREDLVQIHLDREQAMKEMWSGFPEVEAAETALAAAEEAAKAAAEKLTAEKVRQRTKTPVGPWAEQLKQARADAKAARVARREAILAAKPDADPKIAEIYAAARAAEKATYGQYCKEGIDGIKLYHATHYDVLTHHQAAVDRVRKRRANGEPATMRHHRYDGTGTIAVSLKLLPVPKRDQVSDNDRNPAVVAAPAGRHRNVLQVPWIDPEAYDEMSWSERRHAGRFTVRMRAGFDAEGKPFWVEAPVQAHRMLPADADIVGARLTVRRKGAKLRATINVTARVADADPVPINDGPTVAFHWGWRKDDDGGITVAHWRASSPLAVPRDMRAFFKVEAGNTSGTICIPQRILAKDLLAQQQKADRDKAFNQMRDTLKEWLDAHGPVPDPTSRKDEEAQLTAQGIEIWRSAARLARLAHAWAEQPPLKGSEPLVEQLAQWAHRDKITWSVSTGTASRALGFRDDIFKQVAAIIASQAGQVILDDSDIAQLARQESDLPNAVTEPAAHRRTIAAPGTLRAAIKAACVRDGVAVKEHESAGLSRTCARCGWTNPADQRWLKPTVTCDNCGRTYSPDENATETMLKAA